MMTKTVINKQQKQRQQRQIKVGQWYVHSTFGLGIVVNYRDVTSMQEIYAFAFVDGSTACHTENLQNLFGADAKSFQYVSDVNIDYDVHSADDE